ncbi:peptidylprolyl isomerase [Paraburkholderia sp. BCC1885]|uniref:peptidylprolyl isomerase n=1 Tax=Paraburkholderia sp. BCC1885 TaxID=2562669 RepID=UPI001183A45C|nr:peptidylprolyl isomerase [Paraburkholderia sp. BCC1885]
MKKVTRVMLLAGLIGSASCGAWAQSDVIASAGQVSVTQSDIEKLVKPLSAENRERLAADPSRLDQVVRANLAEKAALAEAKAKGWDKQPQVQAMIEQAQREVIIRSYVTSVAAVPSDYPSDQQIQDAYDSNPGQFTAPRMVHLAQIYIALPPGGDAAAAERTRKQAADIAKQAHAGGADFAALAHAKSDDKPGAANGGDMGFLPESGLLPEVRTAVDKMKSGDVSGPIETRDGFHVIRLVDSHAPGLRPLAEVKEQIRTALRQQKQQQDAQAYMQKLAGSAPINEDALRKALSTAQ